MTVDHDDAVRVLARLFLIGAIALVAAVLFLMGSVVVGIGVRIFTTLAGID